MCVYGREQRHVHVCVLIKVSAKVASVFATDGFHHSGCTENVSLSLFPDSLISPYTFFLVKHYLMYLSF